MTQDQIEIADNLKLVNEKYHDNWMNERMRKGYSFQYVKGNVKGVSINIMVICIETEEYLDMNWK